MADMTFDDLRAKLAIDLDALHQNAEEQPSLAEDAGELAAETKAKARRAKLAVEEGKAVAERKVRATPEKFGITKATEAAIASAVVVHDIVKEAQREYISTSEEADRHDALANAFEHRKAMLKLEGKLYGDNYWGDSAQTTRQVAPAVEAGKSERSGQYRKHRARKGEKDE